VTLTVSDTVADAEAPTPRRRRWPWVVVLVVVLALIAAGTSAVVYAHTYSPLSASGGSGPTFGAVRGVTDGVTDPTRFIVVGPSGSTGSVAYTIENDGSHAVTVLGSAVEPNTGLFGILSRVSWSPITGPNGLSGGQLQYARRFPVTLTPHETIELYATVTKPRCESGSVREIDEIPLRTKALGVHHEWDLPLSIPDIGFGFAPIDVCSPRSALKHLSQN
jgi:hypothetical protein